MRKVISNSTPLIILSKIGELEILKNLYGETGDELSFRYYAIFHHFNSSDEVLKNVSNTVFDSVKVKVVESSKWI